MLRLPVSSVAALTALTILACDQTSGPPDDRGNTRVQSAALQMQAGDSQYATVGMPVSVNPRVLVVDDSGRRVQGVRVIFAVTAGGGSAAGTEALSDSGGFATVGSWTLGPDVGRNTLTATIPSSDADPIVFTAIAMCDCWKPKASLSGPRYMGGSAAIDGKLYVVGGSNGLAVQLPLEVYDPSSDTWTSHGLLPLMYDGAVAALGGRLYLAAGAPSQTPAPWLQSYDPATDQWLSRAAPPTQRFQFRLAALGGKLYALGGLSYGELQNTVEAYDPATDTWTTKAPMLRGRYWMGVAVANGILYAIGGAGTDTIQGVPTFHILSTVEAYDPATDTWTSKASLPVPVSNSTAAVVDGIIYLMGGGPFIESGTVNVYAYDPQKDKWTVQPPMPAKRYNATASTLDGMIYVIGGNSPAGGLSSVITLKP